MVAHIQDFLDDWANESSMTLKIMEALTDASLPAYAEKEGWTLGTLAWHVTTAIPEMLSHTGLTVSSLSATAELPAHASDIASSYKKVAAEATEAIRTNWTDETLDVVDNMYGFQWPRRVTLEVLIRHQIHHRAQMTVFMRLAGVRVPGIYGPSREEMAEMSQANPQA